VQVTTDTYPGKTYHGRLSFISSTAEFTPKSIETQKERVTLVYRIKIDLPNPTHELKPGMPADAVLESGTTFWYDPQSNAGEGGQSTSQARPRVQQPLPTPAEVRKKKLNNADRDRQAEGNADNK